MNNKNEIEFMKNYLISILHSLFIKNAIDEDTYIKSRDEVLKRYS